MLKNPFQDAEEDQMDEHMFYKTNLSAPKKHPAFPNYARLE
jgi:hypothetical protein